MSFIAGTSLEQYYMNIISETVKIIIIDVCFGCFLPNLFIKLSPLPPSKLLFSPASPPNPFLQFYDR